MWRFHMQEEAVNAAGSSTDMHNNREIQYGMLSIATAKVNKYT